MKLIDMIRPGKQVHFYFAKGTQLWYITDDDFVFPVPFSDMGDGKFLPSDKAIIFMRYIRKQLKRVEEEDIKNLDV